MEHVGKKHDKMNMIRKQLSHLLTFIILYFHKGQAECDIVFEGKYQMKYITSKKSDLN